VYNSAVFPLKFSLLMLAFAAALALAQQPPVKVNVLNVCAPSAEDQKELSAALAKIPPKPSFSKDFEVARGRTTLSQGAQIPGLDSMPTGTGSTANWVRVRREFPDSSQFTNAQYSFSADSSNMVETLVFHVREPKDVVQISIEDSASSVTSAALMLASNTPVSRVKLERFGKSSIVLARCSAAEGSAVPDQGAYEPILKAASTIMSHYRDALGARQMVPQELARVSAVSAPARTRANGKKKSP
jgi:hypothetical protein